MGKLERKLDLEVIARVAAGIRHKPQPIKKLKPPRAAHSYRGAKRNAVLRGDVKGVWRGAKPNGRRYRAPVRANRAAWWKPFPGGKLYGPNAR